VSGRAAFVAGLKEIGIDAVVRDDGRIVFPYRIELGRFAGTEARIGLEVADDWPRNPPGGPHVCPRLIAERGATPGGAGVSNASAFGGEFEYWSRPYHRWGRDGQSVEAYLAHLRRLFDTA
jgi:hypothetical protein